MDRNLREFGVCRSVVNMRLVMVKFRVKCSVIAPGLCVVAGFTAARENKNDRDKIRTGSL